MSKRDYYEILGVSSSVTEAELKTAFRKAAMQYHPDRNPSDKEAEARFKEVNEAYQILSDPQKKAAYDRFGHAAFEHGGGAGAHMGDEFMGSMADVFEDLFGDLMGRGRRSRDGRERGGDLRYNMEITLEEAFKGKEATIHVPIAVTCETCKGTGAKEGSKPKTCSTCKGHGRIRAQQGFFTIERTCPKCQGQGQMIEDPCSSCSGTGRVVREKTLSVSIPAGVDDGARIRLAGEGEAGIRGGSPGDLYIFLSVTPHHFFKREGADLHCRVPVSMVQAALGGEFSVCALDGSDVTVKLTEGTQSGHQFRIRGKGMPVLRGRGTGDLYIQAIVETPQNLTKRQKELLAEFDTESSAKTHPESAGFFAKMRDLFENLSGG